MYICLGYVFYFIILVYQIANWSQWGLLKNIDLMLYVLSNKKKEIKGEITTSKYDKVHIGKLKKIIENTNLVQVLRNTLKASGHP